MANVKLGPIVSDITGSVGEQTFARNAAGLYVRNRSGPADNTGDNRVACRTALAALAVAWSTTLTDTQRASWRRYARQHPRLNRFGQSCNTAGYNRFIAINFRRRRHDSTIPFLTAPTSPPLWPPLCAITADDSADTVTIVIPPATYQTPNTGLELWAYLGQEQPPGVDFYAGPWSYAGRNLFTSSWTSNPWILSVAAGLTAGNKIWCKLYAQDHNTGEMSGPFLASCEVLA